MTGPVANFILNRKVVSHQVDNFKRVRNCHEKSSKEVLEGLKPRSEKHPEFHGQKNFSSKILLVFISGSIGA